MIKQLRPQQVLALEMLRESLRSGHKRPMIQAACGFGKTLLAAAVVEGALVKGRRVIFTVPALSLVDQTVEAFEAEGIEPELIAVMQADHPRTNPDAPIQVVSVATLARRALPAADIVVVDEAHVVFKSVVAWMRDEAWARTPFVGLSATPWSKGLGLLYDDLLIPTTTRALIEAGFLVPLKVYAPSHPDLSRAQVVRGDYHEGDLHAIMGDAALVADIVQTWLRLGEHRPTVCFAVNRAHARQLQEAFLEAGVPAAYIDATTKRDERLLVLEKFAASAIKVICNVDCLGVGIDADIRCVIYARPTRSIVRFVQNIGRGMRPAEGKDRLLVLDHSDTTITLGFPQDIQREKLSTSEREEASFGHAQLQAPPLPKLCAKCQFVKPPLTPVCPECGFVMQGRSEVITVDGKLVELDGEALEEARRVLAEREFMPSKAALERDRQLRSTDKAEVFGGLLWIRRERGYKTGWAAALYREYFGVWPRGLDGVRAQEPSMGLRAWVKSRNLAYVKAREKERAQLREAFATQLQAAE